MAEVKLQDVSKVYEGSVTAVSDVSFTVSDKEFVVLVGPSGCGKSTALRMIAGLEEITRGTISIDGKVVNEVAPKDRDIAMVFQNYALYPHMTVYDNLAFGLKMRKYAKDDIQRRVHQAAEILGLKDFLDRKPKALSGGQRQRVALGRAIVRQPKAFLFDEPLSNLDANLRVQMRTEISRLHKQLESTMIYVTHDQIEAMSMGDRIVVMKGGVVQQIDTPLNIYNNPSNKFVAGFIGSPTMNFFDGKIISDGGLVFQGDAGQLRLPITSKDRSRIGGHAGKVLTVGIRPEHIAAKRPGESSESVSATIDVVEPVGNEIFLYFRVGNSPGQNVSRIAADVHPAAGAATQLFFDTTKLHFFSKETGEAL